MGIKNVTTLQGDIVMRGKSVSEQHFSGVRYNVRVFQGIFPGAKKIQGFPGSSRVFFQGQRKSRVFQGLPGFPGFPGFVGHPAFPFLVWFCLRFSLGFYVLSVFLNVFRFVCQMGL